MMLFAKKKMCYVTLSDSELHLAKYALIQFRKGIRRYLLHQRTRFSQNQQWEMALVFPENWRQDSP